jgi:hypothetical protein
MQCLECTGDIFSRGTSQDTWNIGYCKPYHFLRSLAHLTIDIFALSLFHDPESLFVQLPSSRGAVFDKLIGDFQEFLKRPYNTSMMPSFSDHELIGWAKYTVGHQDGTILGTIIGLMKLMMSSYLATAKQFILRFSKLSKSKNTDTQG